MPKGDNNRKLSDEQRDEAVRRYTTPLPDGTWVGVPTIARQFGVSNFALQTLLRKRNVKTRSAKEAWVNGKVARPGRYTPPEPAPLCKCGCGTSVVWLRRRMRWSVYAPGHYTQRGEQNPRWNDGSSQLPYPYNWDLIAARIRKRDGWTCQQCGVRPPIRSGRIHVHHIDRDRSNNADSNLLTLCIACHSRQHVDHL